MIDDDAFDKMYDWPAVLSIKLKTIITYIIFNSNNKGQWMNQWTNHFVEQNPKIRITGMNRNGRVLQIMETPSMIKQFLQILSLGLLSELQLLKNQMNDHLLTNQNVV